MKPRRSAVMHQILPSVSSDRTRPSGGSAFVLPDLIGPAHDRPAAAACGTPVNHRPSTNGNGRWHDGSGRTMGPGRSGGPVIGVPADQDRMADHLGDRARIHHSHSRHHRGPHRKIFLAAAFIELLTASVRRGWGATQTLSSGVLGQLGDRSCLVAGLPPGPRPAGGVPGRAIVSAYAG